MSAAIAHEPPPIELTFTPISLEPATYQLLAFYVYLTSDAKVLVRRGESRSVDTVSIDALPYALRVDAFRLPLLRFLVCVDVDAMYEDVYRLFDQLRSMRVRQVVLNPPPVRWYHNVHWNPGEDPFVILALDETMFIPCRDWLPEAPR